MKFVPVTAQDLYFSPTVKIEYAQTQCGRLLRSRFYETHVCVEEFSVGFYEKRSRFDTLLCTYTEDCPQQNGSVVPAGDMFMIHYLPDVKGECLTGCVLHAVDGSFSEVPRYNMKKA